MLLVNRIIIIATRNLGKVKEFAHFFRERQVEVRSLMDYKDLPDIVEDGETFAENALKKAQTIALALNLPVLADDSGLCVDALYGAPGVWSARYAGEHASDTENCDKLLRALAISPLKIEHAISIHNQPSRPQLLSAARFVCALALYDPAQDDNIQETILQVEESCEGFIIPEPRGLNGFGYDPVFYLPAFGRTMAELSVEEKNRLSHRAKALSKLIDKLDSNTREQYRLL